MSEMTETSGNMTELCNVVTRDPKEVKIGDIEEPNEGREPCNDVAKNPIINGVQKKLRRCVMILPVNL